MRLTVLVDNTVLPGYPLRAQPGLSFWIETDGQTILFDLGEDGLFLENARILNIPVYKADNLVISHGHSDHIGGLSHWLSSCLKEKKDQVRLVTHPRSLVPKFIGNRPTGNLVHPDALENHLELILTKEAYWLTKRLVFLGEITRSLPFESFQSKGSVRLNGKIYKDDLMEDSALAYKSNKGLVIITGCSHSGICNIIETAKHICQEERIHDVLGGLHLIEPSKERWEGTLEYLKKTAPDILHPCHCTKEIFRRELGKELPLEDMGSGKIICYE